MVTKHKKTGKLFIVGLRVSDGQVPYKLVEGESYLGRLHDVYQIDKSDKMEEFVYTRMTWTTFEANELTELAMDCILHSRLEAV